MALRLNKAKRLEGVKEDAFTLCHQKHTHIQIDYLVFILALKKFIES